MGSGLIARRMKYALRFLPDETFIRLYYFLKFKKRINLDNPQNFNEKLNWLKLHDRRDIYTIMADKYEAKQYASDIIDNKYIVPTYGVYDSFDEIDFDKLPDEFILKCTHDCDTSIIVHNKKDFDVEKARKKICNSMKKNYFYIAREWPYKNIKPRIIVEKLLHNDDDSELIEYNYFCFHGVPKYVMVCHGDKRVKRYNDFYDIKFNKLDLKVGYDNSTNMDRKPKQFYEMSRIAKSLSKDVPHLRVDFYVCNGKVYLGELTFYHFSGFGRFNSKECNNRFGSLI